MGRGDRDVSGELIVASLPTVWELMGKFFGRCMCFLTSANGATATAVSLLVGPLPTHRQHEQADPYESRASLTDRAAEGLSSG